VKHAGAPCKYLACSRLLPLSSGRLDALQSVSFSVAVGIVSIVNLRSLKTSDSEPKGRRKRGHWEDLSNQREFLEQLGQELNIRQVLTPSLCFTDTLQPLDWSSVTRTQIERKGGYALFWHYSSLDEALRAIFPEINWPSYLGKTGAEKWNDKAFLSEAMSSLGRRLGVEKVLLSNIVVRLIINN
jgi:hypothetical protein